MRVHLYNGSLDLVGRSGVGQAFFHQKAMLEQAGVTVTESWKGHSDAVHINTVLPDAVFAALRAHLRGETVVYYGHSTMQDFRDSFPGSNLLAPVFRQWLRFCYRLGDFIITPTPYSRSILESYHLHRPIYDLTNGVDTDFFAPDPARRAAFRQTYQLEENTPVVVSAGHYFVRKGVLDFIELARAMPEVKFFWFGYTDPALTPAAVRHAIDQAPGNLHFPGFVSQEQLRDAYCGADVFVFCSHEETEGIVVLEALACGTPTLLRDIPVYQDWLTDGVNVWKGRDLARLEEKLRGILTKQLPDLTGAGRRVAEARSLPRIGQALQQFHATLPAPQRNARPAPQRRTA